MSGTTLERTTDGTGPAEAPGGDAARDAAIASLKRKHRFAEDCVAYAGINLILWTVWAITDPSVDGVLPWPAWVSLIWGLLLAIDGWRAYGTWPRGLRAPITEEDIAREIERERRR